MVCFQFKRNFASFPFRFVSLSVSAFSLILPFHVFATSSESIIMSGHQNDMTIDDYWQTALEIAPNIKRVSLENMTITHNGGGRVVDNLAETSDISLNNVNIYTNNGVGIRTAVGLNEKNSAKIVVSGRGAAIVFKNADGTPSQHDFVLSDRYKMNVNGHFSTGLHVDTQGHFENHATITVRHSYGGPAIILGRGKSNVNYGNLISNSQIAPLVSFTEITSYFENKGVIKAASPSHLAIYGAYGPDHLWLTSGYIRGEINTDSGEDKVTLGKTILEGGITMGVGNNDLTVNQTDLSTVRHFIAKKGFGNRMTLNNVNAKLGSFLADDLSKGTNIGDGWQIIHLNDNSIITLTDNVDLYAGRINIDRSSRLKVADAAHLTLNGSLDNSGILDLTQHNLQGKSLTINGNYSSLYGEIFLDHILNANGNTDLDKSSILTILGNVTGKTKVNIKTVKDWLNPVSTRNNYNGIVNPEEGASLINVKGNIEDGAFYADEGSLTSGPYVYKIYSFEDADNAQITRQNSKSNWTFRLANSMICQNGQTTCAKEKQRVQLITQATSYVSLPVGIAQYNTGVIDELHKRLGTLSQSKDSFGADVFARYIGQRLDYSTDRNFSEFGYDFDFKSNGFQLGTNLLYMTTPNKNQLRAGIAWTTGQSTLTPDTFNNASKAKITSNTFGLYFSYIHHSGAFVDLIGAVGKHKIKVSTPLNGEMNKIDASGFLASFSAGFPFELATNTYLKPVVQLLYDGTTLDDSVDKQHARVVFDDKKHLIGRVSLELSKTWKQDKNNEFTPFIRAGYTTSLGNKSTNVTISDEDASNISSTIKSGSFGNSANIDVGFSYNYNNRATFYGEVDYQTKLGNAGSNGVTFNVGTRIIF